MNVMNVTSLIKWTRNYKIDSIVEFNNNYVRIYEDGTLETRQGKRWVVRKGCNRKEDNYIIHRLKDKDGKFHNFYKHQIIGQYFLCETMMEGLTIDYIDRNKNNNHYKNLRWVNSIIQNNNKNIDKFIEKISKPVIQYDLYHNKIAEYSSIKEASRITDIPISNISLVVRGKRQSSGGFCWSFINNELMPKLKMVENSSPKNILGYVDNELIYEFNSPKDAYNATGINSSNIVQCCKGKRKSVGKYNNKCISWFYKGSDDLSTL